MKNIFLIKKIKNFFSFGKDSVYSYNIHFYKKKNFFYVNYNNYKIKNIKIIKKFNFNFFINIIKNESYNELIMRKIRISLIKKWYNIFFIKNHHYLDKIEFIFLNIFKKKKKIKNIWYFNKYYFIKPFYKIYIKKIFTLLDKSNKNIQIKRNYIRCIISNL